MKKLVFTIATVIFCSTIFAQEAGRKFTPSIKVGVGAWNEEPSVFNAELGVQGEYKPTNRFSVYANISYNRMFEISEVSYGINHLTFLAGPRLYITKSFFTGVGAGYLLFVGEGLSGGSFAFSPHIGFDRPKAQWTLNYTATTEGGISGFITLGAAFKLGSKRAAK